MLFKSGYLRPDIRHSVYENTFDCSSQESGPESIFIKPSGDKFYIGGYATDSIYQYSLSTPYNISTASYDAGKVLSVASEVNNGPTDIHITSGGDQLLASSISTLYQYTLSTPWDISSGSYDSISLDTSALTSNLQGFCFSSNGLVLFVLSYETGGDDVIYQYTLTSAFDISTAIYASKSFALSQDTIMVGIDITYDGTRLFTSGKGSDAIYQYALNTANDVSTAVYDTSFSISSQEINNGGMRLHQAPDKIYIAGTASGGDVYQYSL